MQRDVLLKVDQLRTEFFSSKTKSVTAVDKVSFDIYKGEILGLVGESGCGKSVTSLSVMQLLKDTPGKVTHGQVLLDGKDLLKMSGEEVRGIRGGRMSMIFQEPMSALNPSMRIDRQMMETIMLHTNKSKEEARSHAAAMLGKVGIPDPPRVLKNYPHQLSGGMSQRVMIAMALSCDPQLLIADEPTTALDVTIQAQVLEMMRGLKKQFSTAMILITHDLGVVAETCQKAAIMYAGEIVEYGTAEHIFHHTSHPYTEGLFGSIPNLNRKVDRLTPIPGLAPDPAALPKGCKFVDRCKYATDRCREEVPQLTDMGDGHKVRCFRRESQEVKSDG